MIHMQLENINNPKKVYKCTWLLYTCSNSTYVKFLYRVKRECLYFYTAYMSNKFSNIAVDISLFTAIPSFVVFSFTKYSVQGKLQSCLLRPYLQLSIFTDLECLITIDSINHSVLIIYVITINTFIQMNSHIIHGWSKAHKKYTEVLNSFKEHNTQDDLNLR